MVSVTVHVIAFAVATLLGNHTMASAQAYPSKPVRIIVPYAPGGGGDTLSELINYAKTKPGLAYAYSGTGTGTGAHLAGELFRSMAGVDLIPYKGGGAVMPDVIAGRVHMSIATLPSSLSHVRSGKLRALGLASTTRSSTLPELPTISEAGLPGYDASNWMGLFAPARTPRAIVDQIDAVFREVLRAPALKDKLLNQCFESADGGKQRFAKTVADEIVKWRKIIREPGAKVQ